MNLRGITGVHTGLRNPSIGGIETKDKGKHNRNFVLLAAPRLAALALINMNAFGLATAAYYKIFQFYDETFWLTLAHKWYNLGGKDDYSTLKAAIKKGSKRKVLGIRAIDWIKKRDGALAGKMDKYLGLLFQAINYYKSQGIDLRERKGVRGIGSIEIVLATLASASAVVIPILTAITGLLVALPSKKEEDIEDETPIGPGTDPGKDPYDPDKAAISPILLIGLLGAAAFMAMKNKPKS
jgi:hypothetical protein